MDLDIKYFYLPKKHWKKHDQCERLIIQLENFITDKLYIELRIQTLALPETPKLNDKEHIFDFLLKNNMLQFHDKLVRNALINALIIDTCYFIQEAISCSKKKRLSVCFALLRKPFVYNLVVFLRIMYDEDFLNQFNTIESFDSSAIDDIKKKALIKKSLPNLVSAKTFTEDDIFDMIFNQKLEDSLINISNKALHLSTTRNNNKTGIQNLNFIFANQENIEGMWNYIYRRLPALLLYYVELIELLVFNIVDLPQEIMLQRIKERLEILTK